jgi:photosystem II stability/assembly factor-like uncharacterized protein
MLKQFLLLTSLFFASAASAQPQLLSTTEMHAQAGRVLMMLTHPQQEQVMWAGTMHGGLWQSRDGGNSWQLASDAMRDMAVAAIAQDPGNPDVLYAGTGEGRSSNASGRGRGMFKSGDGGKSWHQLPLTSPDKVGENWSRITSIAINTAGVVLAATADNNRNGFIYRSSDGGQSWGLFPVYAGSKVGPRNMIHKIKFDPDNPNTALFMDDYANLTHSSDGGISWEVVRKSSTNCK